MKIGIIGSGFVGSTSAYAMVMRGVGREIVMIDLDKKRAQAEADDILHAAPFAEPVNVYAGDYADLVGSQVVILTAGVSQRPGESRLELLGRNARIFDAIVPQVFANAPEAILLVATNPVDIMTHLAAHTAAAHGIPSTRVLGSGTTLDTARFRALLGRNLGVDPQHVHGYVVGEHGDSEVLTWSSVDIGGIPLLKYCQMSGGDVCTEDKALIDDQVRHAAYHIIEGKGSTYYGIGSAIAKITEVILNNQRAILTVCTPIKEVVGVNDVTISLPHLIGGDGIITTLFPSLDANETDGLQRSAGLIRGLIDQLEKEGLL
jgi:L-lactate dehydrogenase